MTQWPCDFIFFDSLITSTKVVLQNDTDAQDSKYIKLCKDAILQCCLALSGEKLMTSPKDLLTSFIPVSVLTSALVLAFISCCVVCCCLSSMYLREENP